MDGKNHGHDSLDGKKAGFELEFIRPEGEPGEEALFEAVRMSLSHPLSPAQGFWHELSVVSECSIDDPVRDGLSRGFEIVTPPWPGPVARERLTLLLAWACEAGMVCSETTGLHMNISFDDESANGSVMHPAIGSHLDEDRILSSFGRSGNPDCQPFPSLEIPSDCMAGARDGREALAMFLDAVSEENGGAEKTLGIVERFSESGRYFEFRHAGGAGYALRPALVAETLDLFASSMDGALALSDTPVPEHPPQIPPGDGFARASDVLASLFPSTRRPKPGI